MFSHWLAALRTKVWPDRSVLRKDTRTYRKVLRHFEEELKAISARLAKDEATGDVDNVVKHFSEGHRSLNGFLARLLLSEGDLIIVEENTLKRLAEVQRLYGSLVSLPSLSSEERPILQSIGRALKKIYEVERVDLETEYNVVLREAKGERGAWQNLVVSVNELQEASDALWRLRSSIRGIKRDEKALAKDERSLVAMKPGAERLKALKRLDERTKKLHQEILRSVNDFRVTLKVFVDVYFKLWQEEDGFRQRELERLKKTGFPVRDIERIVEYLKKDDELLKAKATFVANVMRRAARLTLNRQVVVKAAA